MLIGRFRSFLKMILSRFGICAGEHVERLGRLAQDLLMKDICPQVGGCFIGMMETKMTLDEFLDEFLDPKFQEMLQIVEKVLEENNELALW